MVEVITSLHYVQSLPRRDQEVAAAAAPRKERKERGAGTRGEKKKDRDQLVRADETDVISSIRVKDENA